MLANIDPRSYFSKQKIFRHFGTHRYFYLSALVVLLLGIVLLPSYRYQINPDGVAYIGIAQKYLHGDIRHAINGYWGPLLSWLMVPGLAVSIDPIITIKLIQLATVVGIMAMSYVILKNFVKQQVLTVGTTVVIGLLALKWAFIGPLTPDLLVCLLSLVLVYLAAKLATRCRSYWLPVSFGIVGSLLYFSKSVGFFLFGGTWAVLAIMLHLRYRQRRFSIQTKGWNYTVASIVTFLVIIVPFVAVISLKYHRPTIGTSGTYNFAFVGPKSMGHPVEHGIIRPPNSTAVSGWEDISNVKVVTWKPYSSWYNAGFFFTNMYKNLQALQRIMTVALWFLVPLALLFYLSKDDKPFINRFKFFVVIFSLFNVLAYLPIFIEERYIYFVLVAIIIGSAGFVTKLTKNYRWFVVLLVVVYGLISFNAVFMLLDKTSMNKSVYTDSQTLKPYLNSNIHIASDEFVSIYACYYTNAKCMGVINSDWPDLAQQLKNYDIQYLLLYNSSAKNVRKAGLPIEEVPGTIYQDKHLYRVPQ